MKLDSIKRAEWIVAILLTAMIFCLLLVRATHAGGLWRDECNSVQLAQMPTFGEISRQLKYDSFPLLFPALLRGYIKLCGSSDMSLRYFGLGVGILFLGLAWFEAGLIGAGAPLLFLALVGLNTTFLNWGTSVRAYGLGSATIVLAFALTKKLVDDGKPRWMVAAFLAYFAGLQLLFHNLPLAFAIGFAAIVVSIIGRRPRLAAAVCTIGAVCAIFYLPYWKTSSSIDWNAVMQYDLTFRHLLSEFSAACGQPAAIIPAVWGFALLASIGAALWRLSKSGRRDSSAEAAHLFFGVAVMLISLGSYYLFLLRLGYRTEVWYYLPLICVLAGAVDLVVTVFCRSYWLRVARLGFVAGALVILPFFVWPKVVERQTNVDQIAEKLRKLADRGDLIVVNPWPFGVSFCRYYAGEAPWITVPNISEHRVHRFDLVKAKMREIDPLADIRAAITRTLQSGNRVWIVGGARSPDEGVPISLGPAPHAKFGWSGPRYLDAWSAELGAFLRAHVIQGGVFLPPASAGVNQHENVPLLVARGWRD